MLGDGLAHRGQALQLDHLGGGTQAAQQHDDGFAHQRVIVNDKNTHGGVYCRYLVSV
ncbi:hypothetical protein D9M68_978900 [compost metagenome]